jgi:hypothetical protein
MRFAPCYSSKEGVECQLPPARRPKQLRGRRSSTGRAAFSATDRQRRNDAYFALVVVIVIPSVFLLGLTAFVWRRNARRKAEQECAEGRRHQQPGNRTVDPSKEDKKWWNVLQVSRDANASDIRRSYLRIIQQYHPDRLAGLAPELVELAERRSKTLNAAYAEALHMRGEA